MTITLREYSPTHRPNRSGDAIRLAVDFSKEGTGAESLLYRIDASKTPPITVDINAGLALGAGAGTLIGTTRAAAGGSDVVVNCTASDRGTLIVEDSTDGTAFLNAQSFPVYSGQTLGVRFSTTAGSYRARFVVAAGEAASKVLVTSQVRAAGV
jgi:hypothetical protein